MCPKRDTDTLRQRERESVLCRRHAGERTSLRDTGAPAVEPEPESRFLPARELRQRKAWEKERERQTDGWTDRESREGEREKRVLVRVP